MHGADEVRLDEGVKSVSMPGQWESAVHFGFHS